MVSRRQMDLLPVETERTPGSLAYIHRRWCGGTGNTEQWIRSIRGSHGECVYYIAAAPQRGIRRIRPDGAGDSLSVDAPVLRLAYAVTSSGVWFVNGGSSPTVEVRRSADGRRSVILQLPFEPYLGFSLSPDERYLLLTKPDEKGTDLMLVENFR